MERHLSKWLGITGRIFKPSVNYAKYLDSEVFFPELHTYPFDTI
jgi:hypothetical protein